MANPEIPKKTTEVKETKEEKILQIALTKDKIYPGLSTENFDKYGYKDLVAPLEKNTDCISSTQKDFLNNMHAVEESIKEVISVPSVYLEEVFASSNTEELDKKITTSATIKRENLNDEQIAKIKDGYNKYYLYRDMVKKQLQTEDLARKETETVFTPTLEYAKSGEKWVADKIQKIRENWAGMDGGEKTAAGLTILIGTAWFLNNDSEAGQKIRDTIFKAGMLGLGYVGANAASKALTGVGLKEMAKKYVDDKSGKRDFLKESFDTDIDGAENMQTSLAVLGNHDFMELADMYIMEEARVQKFYIPETHREISVGGVAENEMSAHKIYLAMKLLDKKLKKGGSSIESLQDGLKKAKIDADVAGKNFFSPTWAMIITSVLQSQDLGYAFDEKGNVIVESKKFESANLWGDKNAEGTNVWWPVNGEPKDWKTSLISNVPKTEVNRDNLKRISSSIIEPNQSLLSVINGNNFGRFTNDFTNLYNDEYASDSGRRFYFDKNNQAVISKFPIDKKFPGSIDAAMSASVKSAHEQAITELGKTDTFKGYENNSIAEFVQPVFGTFIGDKKENAQEYVMFLRVVVPGSKEFELRKNREWPDGDMITHTKAEILGPNNQITITDFKDFNTREEFKGVYRSFLARTRLTTNKEDEDAVKKILEFYSKEFANSGMTRAGLIRYLATHEFTPAEIKKARGMKDSEQLKHEEDDVYAFIKKATEEYAKGNIDGNTPENTAGILNSLGHIVILACNGDLDELNKITEFNQGLRLKIETFRDETLQSGQKTEAKEALINDYKTIVGNLYNFIKENGLDKAIKDMKLFRQ